MSVPDTCDCTLPARLLGQLAACAQLCAHLVSTPVCCYLCPGVLGPDPS